jgi:nucleotide-binding universal stress UspA family protein
LICGIALSTTSVAVVYAVMIETGLNETDFGKLILAACFITDLGTVVALGAGFANYDWSLRVFGVVADVVLWWAPRFVNWMVDEVDEVRQGAESHFRQIGEAAVQFARSRGVHLHSVVVRGHADEAIVRYAESVGMNLVVLGQHGHSRIARFFLGSTTDRVSEHCGCSVRIVR